MDCGLSDWACGPGSGQAKELIINPNEVKKVLLQGLKRPFCHQKGYLRVAITRRAGTFRGRLVEKALLGPEGHIRPSTSAETD